MDEREGHLATARDRMVAYQLRSRGIVDERVLEAFEATPRHRFIPPELAHEAYEDYPVPIGFGQTISQPYVVALMVQELSPQPHHRVLDVGAGSGYQTAILARLARHVYAVERIDALTRRARDLLESMNVRNVTIRTGDGTLGWPEEAPFDGIICGAGAPEVPAAWVDQLADGGRIVLPVGGSEVQALLAVERRREDLSRREFGDVRFVKLIGRHGWPEAPA
jgi:protein-L-isoaspartate(D-aspartate) O-methyltransferase